MLWANPSKAHVLLITAARASQLYWLLFVISFVKFVCVFVLGLQCNFFCQVCVCVCTGFTIVKHDATSLFGKYIQKFVLFYLFNLHVNVPFAAGWLQLLWHCVGGGQEDQISASCHVRGIFRERQETRFLPNLHASFLVVLELFLCWARCGGLMIWFWCRYL